MARNQHVKNFKQEMKVILEILCRFRVENLLQMGQWFTQKNFWDEVEVIKPIYIVNMYPDAWCYVLYFRWLSMWKFDLVYCSWKGPMVKLIE